MDSLTRASRHVSLTADPVDVPELLAGLTFLKAQGAIRPLTPAWRRQLAPRRTTPN